MLNGLSSDFSVGCLDVCLAEISDILTNDLFGVPAEERETPEAISKLPEAKSTKSFDSYALVASKLSPSLLPDLILPLKEVRQTD